MWLPVKNISYSFREPPTFPARDYGLCRVDWSARSLLDMTKAWAHLWCCSSDFVELSLESCLLQPLSTYCGSFLVFIAVTHRRQNNKPATIQSWNSVALSCSWVSPFTLEKKCNLIVPCTGEALAAARCFWLWEIVTPKTINVFARTRRGMKEEDSDCLTSWHPESPNL